MADQPFVVACPLCAGQGEVSLEAIVDLFSDPELRQRFESRIAEIADVCNSVSSTGTGKVPDFRKLDFQKEVHTWNPTLPIWRRSSKE